MKERILLTDDQIKSLDLEVMGADFSADAFRHDLPLYRFKGTEIYLSQVGIFGIKTKENIRKGLFTLAARNGKDLRYVSVTAEIVQKEPGIVKRLMETL